MAPGIPQPIEGDLEGSFRPTPGTVRSCSCKVQPDYKNIEPVRVLSGVLSRRRSRLCRSPMNQETNVLLLDEPTNHLDVDYQGTKA